METIKLSGNKFPVAESPVVEHTKQAKQAENAKQAEQDEDQEQNFQVDYQGDFELKEFESEEEKNEKRTLIRKIMR